MIMAHEKTIQMFSQQEGQAHLEYLWLELTGLCNLECIHCYADSSPAGTHGSMAASDWRKVLLHAAEMGCSGVTFIGGEPTLHPALPELIEYASSLGIATDVYSNLVRVTDELWDIFVSHGVIVSTSFYSIDPVKHDQVTTRPGSQKRTLDNIGKAIRLGIDVGVGMTVIDSGQAVDRTKALLTEMGVTRISIDGLRAVGRGCKADKPDESALCGSCAGGNAVVTPSGQVFPCIMSRWLPVGNVHDQSLCAILNGHQMRTAKASLARYFGSETPKACNPQQFPCTPRNCCPAYIKRATSPASTADSF